MHPYSLALMSAILGMASCSTAPLIRPSAGTEPDSLAPSLAVAPQKSEMDMMHPRTTILYSAAVGKQNFTINTGTQNVGGQTDAMFHNLRGEYFWPSAFGAWASADLGESDDISDLGGESVETLMIGLGLSYRATIDDDFRMPVRVGPYIHQATLGGSAPNGDTEFSMVGMKLTAEPEFIFMQNELEGGNRSEFTVFLELGLGGGPTTIENDVEKEEGMAFTYKYELGLRYKFSNGICIGLSSVRREQPYAGTNSFNTPGFAFFGSDDDFSGYALTVGVRR
jgi:hypothetical protein